MTSPRRPFGRGWRAGTRIFVLRLVLRRSGRPFRTPSLSAPLKLPLRTQSGLGTRIGLDSNTRPTAVGSSDTLGTHTANQTPWGLETGPPQHRPRNQNWSPALTFGTRGTGTFSVLNQTRTQPSPQTPVARNSWSVETHQEILP